MPAPPLIRNDVAAEILIVPGLRNSGPSHWQSWFETQLPGSRRVNQDDWERPRLPAWADRVAATLGITDSPVWLVAHSFGCLASVAACLRQSGKVRGALLVAPADPQRFDEPEALLDGVLPFPSLVVASSNDPWVRAEVAESWARRWGSDFLNIGAAGHINVDSGHGPWPEGLALFNDLREDG